MEFLIVKTKTPIKKILIAIYKHLFLFPIQLEPRTFEYASENEHWWAYQDGSLGEQSFQVHIVYLCLFTHLAQFHENFMIFQVLQQEILNFLDIFNNCS